jgi:hypothetical protein
MRRETEFAGAIETEAPMSVIPGVIAAADAGAEPEERSRTGTQ